MSRHTPLYGVGSMRAAVQQIGRLEVIRQRDTTWAEHLGSLWTARFRDRIPAEYKQGGPRALSEPGIGAPPQELHIEDREWGFTGGVTFHVAAEVGRRLNEQAHSLDVPVQFVAYGNNEHTDLVIGLQDPDLRGKFWSGRLFGVVVERVNAGLTSDRIALQLPTGR